MTGTIAVTTTKRDGLRDDLNAIMVQAREAEARLVALEAAPAGSDLDAAINDETRRLAIRNVIKTLRSRASALGQQAEQATAELNHLVADRKSLTSQAIQLRSQVEKLAPHAEALRLTAEQLDGLIAARVVESQQQMDNLIAAHSTAQSLVQRLSHRRWQLAEIEGQLERMGDVERA